MNKTLDYIALTLVIIGAVNWGLIGFFKFDPGSSTLWKHELAVTDYLRVGRYLWIVPVYFFHEDR